MKQVTSNGWRRVQARTAAKAWRKGYAVAITGEHGCPDVLEAQYCPDGCDERTTLDTLVNVLRCTDAQDYTGCLWYWLECTATLPARPANHAPAEKAVLAARINGYYKGQGHAAPIDYERVPSIPRHLLRELWAEIREHQANALIQQVANSVIM